MSRFSYLTNSGKFGVSVLAVTVAANSALAQDENQSLAIEEVIVTAQKREQSTQDIPVSLVAFDGDFQRRVNLDDAKDLIKFSPGLSGNSQDSFIDRVNVRGISTNDFGVGGDPSVAFFKNGFYQGRNGVAVTSLFDLERAEVLRGPQGFLFGRNAIAGAISLHTARPSFDGESGYVQLGVGEREIFEAEGAYNIPLSDSLAVRLAGYYSHEDGFVDNFASADDEELAGHEKYALRGTLAYRGENWDWTVSGEYEDRDQSGTVYRAIEDDEIFPTLQDALDLESLRGGPRDIDSDAGLGNRDRGEIWAVTSEINVDLDFAKFTSLTQYRDHTYDYAEDFDGTPLRINDYAQDQEGDYFEQELRLVGQNDGPLSWYAGANIYSEDIDVLFTQGADEEVMCQYYYSSSCSEAFAYYGFGEFTPTAEGLIEANRVIGDYWGWGAYLDLTYQITDKLELGAGIRYSYDKKNFDVNVLPVESELGPFFAFGFTTDGFISGSESWDDVTPRFTLTYRATDDLTLYASATRGYKSGGFGSFGINLGPDGIDDDLIAVPGAVPNSFDPETVWSYEAGIKGAVADGRLRYDIAGYYYDYKDLQLNFFEAGGTRVANIGRVDGGGIEATMQAVVNQHFDVYAAFTYQDSEVMGADQVCDDCDGNRLTLQPKYIFAGAANFHTPVTSTGEINATVDLRTQGSAFGGLENIQAVKTESWTDVSLRVGYEDERGWGIVAYVENLFDETYFENTGEGGDILPHLAFDPARPMTFGMRFTYRFGQ